MKQAFEQAAKRVEKDLPRLKAIYSQFSKTQKRYDQIESFHRILYYWFYAYYGEAVPHSKSEQLKSISQALFVSYTLER